MPAAEHLKAASDFGKRPASSAASLRRAGRFVAPLSTAHELMSIVVRVHPAAATPCRGQGWGHLQRLPNRITAKQPLSLRVRWSAVPPFPHFRGLPLRSAKASDRAANPRKSSVLNVWTVVVIDPVAFFETESFS